MPSTTLFDRGGHRNILLEDFGRGQAVQSNQHLIVQGDAGMVLDPGGHKMYARAVGEVHSILGAKGTVKVLFFSHQDPDIIAAANGWLLSTGAVGYISQIWTRFVPHLGLDRLVVDRLLPIPDEGMWVEMNGARFGFLPAHFLHSPGNFHLLDPISRILYTGDLGGSFGADYQEVKDFDAHIPYLRPFHERYIASSRALKAWVAMARGLDVEVIAPQHGAFFRGREMVARFLDWCEWLRCGVDLLPPAYRVPG